MSAPAKAARKSDSGEGGGGEVEKNPTKNMLGDREVVVMGGGGAADGEDGGAGMDPDHMSSILLAITEKLDQLQKSARMKKALLQASGLDEPVPLGRPLPAFPLGSVPPDHPPRPAFRSMTSEPAARREMSRVASELLSCRAGFESLSRAVSLAQGAEVVSCALDQAAGEDAPVQLDGEEVKHVKGLLSEQRELTLSILESESQRLTAQIELLDSMEKRAAAFAFEEEDMDALFGNDDKDNEGDNTGNDKASLDPATKKKEILCREEAKLSQMKTMLQKLLFALPQGDPDSEEDKKHHEMMMMCGKEIEELRAPYME